MKVIVFGRNSLPYIRQWLPIAFRMKPNTFYGFRELALPWLWRIPRHYLSPATGKCAGVFQRSHSLSGLISVTHFTAAALMECPSPTQFPPVLNSGLPPLGRQLLSLILLPKAGFLMCCHVYAQIYNILGTILYLMACCSVFPTILCGQSVFSFITCHIQHRDLKQLSTCNPAPRQSLSRTVCGHNHASKSGTID